MDIMRPRAWRLCGWAATALLGGIIATTVKIVRDGHGLASSFGPLLNIMIGACAVLTGIRVLVPSIAKIRQEIELNLGLQRSVLSSMDSAPATLKPALKLVPPIDGAEADPPRQRQASSE
jgi:hypothetical protein